MIRLYVHVKGLPPDLPFEMIDLTVTPDGDLYPNPFTRNTTLITNIVFIPIDNGLTPEQLEVVRKLGQEHEVIVTFGEN